MGGVVPAGRGIELEFVQQRRLDLEVQGWKTYDEA